MRLGDKQPAAADEALQRLDAAERAQRVDGRRRAVDGGEVMHDAHDDDQCGKCQLRDAAAAFLRESILPKYSYNFSWLGRPIIQYPQDIIAMQELVWRIQPQLIIETGA